MYNGKFIQVKEASIAGQVWEKVFLNDGVSIYPITEDKKIILIKEKRPHETPNLRLKPVTGIYENEFNLFENVNREMQEEIGFKAKEIELIWEVKSSGTINNSHKFCLAKDLSVSKIPNPDGEDTIQEILYFSVDEIYEKLLSGEIPLRNSFIGIFKLKSIL